MIKEIVKNDINILTKKSESIKDTSLAKRLEKDLYDTANNYADRCIGLSAVQIGEHYKIAVVATNLVVTPTRFSRFSTTVTFSPEPDQDFKPR